MDIQNPMTYLPQPLRSQGSNLDPITHVVILTLYLCGSLLIVRHSLIRCRITNVLPYLLVGENISVMHLHTEEQYTSIQHEAAETI